MGEYTESFAFPAPRPLSYWPIWLVTAAAIVGSAVLIDPNRQVVPDAQRGAPTGKVSVRMIDQAENIMKSTPAPAVQPVSALALTERATVLMPVNTGTMRVNGS